MKNFYKIILLLTLTSQAQLASAQALHWLSQPEVDIGPVANNDTYAVKISSNRRYITFLSRATNLVENDTNGLADVFIRDVITGVTQLVSTTTSGVQATDGLFTSVSAATTDGRYVAFVTTASVFPNAGGFADDYLYVKDMQTGALTNHSDYNASSYFETTGRIYLSNDGQYITFDTYAQIDTLHTASFRYQAYRKHLSSDAFELLSLSHDGLAIADDDAELIDVSSNGQFVLILSDASNLTTDVLNNTGENIYLVDTLTNSTILVNKTPSGASSAFDTSDYHHDKSAVSDAGAVVFVSAQPDLVTNDSNTAVDVFFYSNGIISRINLTQSGQELSQTSINYISVPKSRSASALNASSSYL